LSDDALRDPHLPVLIVTGSKRDGASLVLDAQGYEKILGTSGDCHLRVEGGNVDVRHARVMWDERGVVLSDDGSSTGTYVNGERIGSDHPLEDGDRICLGPPGSRNSVKLLVRVPPEITEAQTIGFTAPALDLAAVHDAPIVLDPIPAPTMPEPPPPPPPRPKAAPVPEPVADEPILLDEPSFVPPADEVFFIDEAPVAPTKKLPTAADEPIVPTVRLPPRPEPLPEPPPIPLVRVEPPPSPRTVAPPPPLPTLRDEPRVAAAPPPLPSISERPRPKPDYAPELPSIAPAPPAIVMDDETGAGDDAPAVPDEAPFKRLRKKREAPPPKAPSGPPSKIVLFGGGAVVVLALVAGGVWMMSGRSGPSPAPGKEGPVEDAGPPGSIRITSLEPEVALPGNTVELVATNVPAQGVKLSVGGVVATIDQNENGRLRFKVPKLPVVVEGQSVPVVVTVGANSSKAADLFLGRLPLVSEASPRSGVPGDVVTVKGRGFDTAPGGNQVSFGEDPALVLAATSSELKVVVPAPRSALNRVDAPVIVKRGASTSGDTVVFNITRPSEGVYKLKFFGSAVEGDTTGEHAFVGTEVGPLLLLTGKGASASVGERATEVAKTLNGLVGTTPKFEVRGFAVNVAGRPEPVVTVTPIDATGYTKPLDPAMSRTMVGLPVIASYWTALLQDAFVLLAKGERPSRVIELSPRGKVMMDLFSEAERQLGRGNGIPTRLVSPPTWTIAKAFREMALVLPTRGGAVAAAAVVGRWRGELQEPGSPPRPLSLELRLEGNALAGTMTTNAGGINLNAPLRDVSYANGVLSFTLLGGTVPRKVQGKVNGAQLEGTIQGAGGAPAGRVSLRYLE
jgi:hypothetical protein